MVGMDIVVTTNSVYTLTMMRKTATTNAIHIAKMDKLFLIQAQVSSIAIKPTSRSL
jgi:hypothetical protein